MYFIVKHIIPEVKMFKIKPIFRVDWLDYDGQPLQQDRSTYKVLTDGI